VTPVPSFRIELFEGKRTSATSQRFYSVTLTATAQRSFDILRGTNDPYPFYPLLSFEAQLPRQLFFCRPVPNRALPDACDSFSRSKTVSGATPICREQIMADEMKWFLSTYAAAV
jgi:hypothetical protein